MKQNRSRKWKEFYRAAAFGSRALLAVICVLSFGADGFARRARTADAPVMLRHVAKATLLEDSAISYRADGGFTGIQGYSVLIVCRAGAVSTLATIHDPRRDEPLRRTGHMTEEEYLALWEQLNRQRVFATTDVERPKWEIRDEFTIRFEVRAGRLEHAFSVHGLNRPEASKLFAIQSLLDQAAGMSHLWSFHDQTAKID